MPTFLVQWNRNEYPALRRGTLVGAPHNPTTAIMATSLSSASIDWIGGLFTYIVVATLTLIAWLRAGRRITLYEAYSRGIRSILRFIIALFLIWIVLVIVLNAIAYFRH